MRDSLAGADVLICSLPASERAALGLDLDGLRKSDPALIVADVSWFGRTGPYADYACADAVCRALAGMVQLVGPAEGPVVAPDYQAAIIGGLSGFIAVMTALNARARGDAGRRMDMSVHEACLALMDLQTADAWFRGAGYAREGINRFPPTYPVGIFPTKDEWIGVTLVTPAQWMGFCRMLGLDDLARPEFTMGIDRFPHADAFEARFIPKLRERSAKEWFDEALRLRLPIVVVPSMSGVLASPEFRARGAIVPVRFRGREVEAPALPLHMAAHHRDPAAPCPRLGNRASSRARSRRAPHRPACGRVARSRASASSISRWAGRVRWRRGTWRISAPTSSRWRPASTRIGGAASTTGQRCSSSGSTRRRGASR